jgi:hypothetical protein
MNVNGTQGSPYQGLTQTRPYDFGTDAIERQRVSLGQSLIDADFEYGLQATKWQTFQELRKFPSFFEIPGTDFTASNVQVDGTTTGNVVVYFSNIVSQPPPIGSVISVSGLMSTDRKADRAEGFFLVTSNSTSANTCNYISKGQILTSVSNVSTSYTTIRRGGIFNNGVIKVPVGTISVEASNTQVRVITSQAHGLMTGTPLTVNNSGQSFNGSFFVSNVVSANTFIISTTVSNVTVSSAANIYMNPFSYTVHRPFDGGVLLSPNQPSFGASCIRQSKKVFRYQSGKGLLWSSGTLFCPNNDISSLSVSGSVITITTDIPHGAPQPGATLIIRGISTPSTINGTYTIAGIIDSRTLTVNSTIDYGTSTNIILGDQPRFIISNWHGSCVRAGTFEDQNGMFWEFDGQTLFVVRRSSTFQLSGFVTCNINQQLLSGQITNTISSVTGTVPDIPIGSSNVIVTGLSAPLAVNYWTGTLGGFEGLGTVWVTSNISATSVLLNFLPTTSAFAGAAFTSSAFNLSNTRFADQIKVNDRVVLRGMTHQVTSVQGQGQLTFNPPYRGATNISTSAPVKACKVNDIRIPQSKFNRDTIDGNGPSAYKVDLTKMQMVGLQYTWYGAGFVDFMIRGFDGNWVYVHRFKNNNVNDEAYMRTGNMPVRYEIINERQTALSTLSSAIDPATTSLSITGSTQYFPPTGTLMVDNELISYTGKTSTSFTGLARSVTLNYNVLDVNRAFIGQPSSNHNSGSTVSLVSVTCAPSLTHWGSAFLMDGNFDSDRGYFFNYANTNVNVSQSAGAATAFAIRLAPSVSNGVVGDMGSRDLMNRSQLLLQKLEVTSSNTINTVGFLNPTNVLFDPTKWINVNTVGNGSQPSFAQIYPGNFITTIPAPGERIFSTIAQQNNQNNLDLTNLKEMSNSVIGGNQGFPDGPDILCIVINNIQTTGPSGPVQVNLFWTEAQA